MVLQGGSITYSPLRDSGTVGLLRELPQEEKSRAALPNVRPSIGPALFDAHSMGRASPVRRSIVLHSATLLDMGNDPQVRRLTWTRLTTGAQLSGKRGSGEAGKGC